MPDPRSPAFSSALRQAAQLLQRGGVVGYPSETVWGLATLPVFAQRLYLRKGRQESKPVQLSCKDAASALACARPDPALTALSCFWPGPLTVVTQVRPEIQASWHGGSRVLAPRGRVGLRVPAHCAALALLEVSGGYLATTSLNPSHLPAATTTAQAQRYALADFLVPDPEPAADEHGTSLPGAAMPSTVVQLPHSPGEPARLLRSGRISPDELRERLRPLGVEVSD